MAGSRRTGVSLPARIGAICLASLLVFTMTPTRALTLSESSGEASLLNDNAASSALDQFTDIIYENGEYHWVVTEGWFETIMASGLMEGDRNPVTQELVGTFRPDDPIKRSEAITVLYRYACSLDPSLEAEYGSTTDAGSYGTHETPYFSDDDAGVFYTAALAWAYDEGVMVGDNNDDKSLDSTTVRPHDSITREELATVIYRYATGTLGADTTGAGASSYAEVPDAGKVTEFAREAVGWCYYNGVMTGDATEEGLLRPLDAVKRAEAAKMFVVGLGIGGEGEDETTDTDGDGIPDVLEEFLGTDPSKADTDGDGLDDWLEIQIGTDPTLEDTDGNGVLDGDEDSDGDGLTNLEEVSLGTDPSEDDSDHDGLNDYEEIYQYGTDPLNSDTDGDGAYDGWEVYHGYDPLVADALFDVTETAASEGISTWVELQLTGEQITTLSVEEVTDSIFLDEEVPGYIGSAFDFSVDGSFDEAKISFEFTAGLLEQNDFVPVIYFYNEETQCLEELATSVAGNVASATVTHFSTYILLNKTEVDAVWDEDIKSPDNVDLNEINGIDVVFVIDSSGSMSSNDSSSLRMTAAKQFVDKLGENDRGAVVDFDSSATLYQAFTSDHDLLYAAINRVNSSGGTSLSAGISLAIAQFTSDDYDRTDAYKCIVFLTDGDGSYSSSYTTLAAENDIVIYTVGLGSGVREGMLKAIAEGTGGKYYFATSAIELPDVYVEISFETIDYTTDSNNDGISDYYTQLLCDGKLRLGTGKRAPLYGLSYDDVQANADYDGDGLSNGRELVVRRDEASGKVYVWLLSDPTSADTDYDGIDDSEEISGYSTDNSFTADMKYDESYDASVSFSVDYRWFFADNTQFNQELSVLASLYALDMYDDGWLEMTAGVEGSSESVNGVSLGKLFGLNDCVSYDANALATTFASVDSNGDAVDADDTAEVFIGHRLVSYQGEQREVIFLTIRGTNGTLAEWSSNFDIGFDASGMYVIGENEHPDWSNKFNHKGFDVAATRIMNAYNQYVEAMIAQGTFDASVERSIFITGHSRGGGIANILGAIFEDDPAYDSYVYTLASPNTTTSASYDQYDTIFNVVNKDDLITYLPASAWNFEKYGETLTVSAGLYEDRNPFSNADGTFKALFGVDYNANSNYPDTVDKFSKIADSRESYYALDTTSDGVVMQSESQYKRILEGNMIKYCLYTEIKNDSSSSIMYRITYAPAYAGQNIAALASASGLKNQLGWLALRLNGVYAEARLSFVYTAIAGITHPHMAPTYYLIANKTSYSSYNSNRTISIWDLGY